MNERQACNAKTSVSHPLRIAEVRPHHSSGRIGITLCPGKKQSDAVHGPWSRNLDTDLDCIRDWGACAVLTLLEDHEIQALSVLGLREAVERRDMTWYHLPVKDGREPGETFERMWAEVGGEIRSRLRNGFDIVVHCKGGLGRAGTVAARLLTEAGVTAPEAMEMVREVRPGAIENAVQERYVLAQMAAPEPLSEQSRDAITDRAIGALAGLAIGDAIGTTVEFRARGSFPPLRDMVGGGPFRLQPGEWTDDTAMALALADSLIFCEHFDEADLMTRFSSWRRDGQYSCTGTCFDIGLTTSAAIDRWEQTGTPISGSKEPNSAGNGSLMRLAPVALRFWNNRQALRDVAERQSRVTHGASAAVSACSVYADMLADAISGCPLDQLLECQRGKSESVHDKGVARVAAMSWRGRARAQIRGSGYVVESMEAAIWCVARSGSFAEAVLTAANLGDDADTTAAIAGQLAGAVYGLSAVPAAWIDRLAWSDHILTVARRLVDASYA